MYSEISLFFLWCARTRSFFRGQFYSKLHTYISLTIVYLFFTLHGVRSLRLVCDSWDLFLEFPGVEEGSSRSHSKRRKVLVDNSALQEAVSPVNMDARISCSIKQEHIKHGLPFLAARDCLISLRISIESLDQKNLFPYNPQVLLRR